MEKFDLPDNREQYTGSGQANWLVWIPGLLIAVAIAAGSAFLLEYLSRWGLHFIFITPLIVVLPLAGWWYFAQRASQSRAPGIAAAAGFLLGLLFYLGRFHAALIIDLGVKEAPRVDHAWHAMVWYMEHQRIGKGDNANQGPPGDFGIAMNWFFLILMAVLSAVIVAGLGALAAGEPFSERYREYLKKREFKLQPGFLSALVRAMRSGSLDDFEEAIRQGMEKPAEVPDEKIKKKGAEAVKPSAKLSVYFIPDAEGLPYRDDPPSEAYLSVGETDAEGKKNAEIQHWSLLPEEVAILERLLIRPNFQAE